MDKLVCESLQEYRFLNEAKGDDDHGVIKGAWRTIKSAPGRALRRKRARSIMQKYSRKIGEKLQKVVDKYQVNIEKLLEKTTNSINNIDTTKSNEIQARQREDILEDMVESFKGVLTNLKEGMQDQLKVYAESLQARLERPGTVTGSEFSPEDKTALMSEWKIVEAGINQEIQSKLINLIDNPNVAKFTEVKAELKEFIEANLRGSYRSNWSMHDADSDESTLSNADEKKLWDIITNKSAQGDKIEFDRPYQIRNKSAWTAKNILTPPFTDRIAFKIDNNKGKIGYAFYEFDKKRGKSIRSAKYPEIEYLIKNGEKLQDGIDRASNIEFAIK